MRRLNLMVSGIVEKTNGTVEERKEYDEECITNLLNKIGLHDCSFHGARRIGKANPDKPRLIRVTCSNADEKRSILKNARKLRSLTQFSKVFINSDLTPMQQKEQRLLREELKRRRIAGENVRIRHGKIVVTDNQNFH